MRYLCPLSGTTPTLPRIRVEFVAIGLVFLLSVQEAGGRQGPPPASRPNPPATAANPTPQLPSDSGTPSPEQVWRSQYGEITFGAPKIWRFDRVYPLLDGLLRDVESISVTQNTALDPNEVHSLSLDFLQEVFALSVKFDEAALLKNRLEMERLGAEQGAVLEQQRLHNDYIVQLQMQRNILRGQLTEVMKLKLEAIREGDQEEVEQVGALAEELNDQISAITEQIAAAQQAKPTKFELQVTGATAPELNAQTQGKAQIQSFWERLPVDVRDQLGKELGKPGLPATKKMDNILTLLRERLARLLAVVHDDVSRADREVYLMQFDVGIFPGKKAKHKVARVGFTLSPTCDNVSSTEPAYAYELYPGQSSYNISQFYGKTRTSGLVANVLTLFGLGVGAEYKRQREQLRSSLVQSVYVSGFGAGGNTFGWYHAPGPFELRTTPGIRTTYAVVVTPKCQPSSRGQSAKLEIKASAQWLNREESNFEKTDSRMAVSNRSLGTLTLPVEARPMRIGQVDYVPRRFLSSLNEQERNTLDATVQILLTESIDPNLIVTVNGKPLRRARDWRGRAVAPGSSGLEVLVGEEGDAGKTKRVPLGRGLIEANSFEPDTWFAVNPRLLLLRISYQTAGANAFPVIRLGDATGSGGELLSLVRHSIVLKEANNKCAGEGNTKRPYDISEGVGVRVDEWEFDRELVAYYPVNVFLPLFIEDDRYLPGFSPGNFRATVAAPTPRGDKIARLQIRVMPQPTSGEMNVDTESVRMREGAQVVLTDMRSEEHAAHWPIWCDESEGQSAFLVCTIEEEVISSVCKGRGRDCSCGLGESELVDWLRPLRVSVDQPAYYETDGVWGSASVEKDEWFVFGRATYSIVPRLKGSEFTAWIATIESQHLKEKDVVRELREAQLTHRVLVQKKALEIEIPKEKLALLPQGVMVVEREGKAVAYLPELRSQLLPRNLRLSDDGAQCVLQGEQLEAVDAVILRAPDSRQLERTGAALVTGARQVRFSLPNTVGDHPYMVRLRVGSVYIDAVDKNGRQLTLKPATLGGRKGCATDEETNRSRKGQPAPK